MTTRYSRFLSAFFCVFLGGLLAWHLHLPDLGGEGGQIGVRRVYHRGQLRPPARRLLQQLDAVAQELPRLPAEGSGDGEPAYAAHQGIGTAGNPLCHDGSFPALRPAGGGPVLFL